MVERRVSRPEERFESVSLLQPLIIILDTDGFVC